MSNVDEPVLPSVPSITFLCAPGHGCLFVYALLDWPLSDSSWGGRAGGHEEIPSRRVRLELPLTYVSNVHYVLNFVTLHSYFYGCCWLVVYYYLNVVMCSQGRQSEC